jgi:hypothetical protein
MFLKTDVAAALPQDYPTVSLQCPEDFSVRETWHRTHTANSTVSALSLAIWSSSVGSKYNFIASLMLVKASSRESPSLMQPGRAGTKTVYPPSSLGSNTILSFTLSPLKIWHEVVSTFPNLQPFHHLIQILTYTLIIVNLSAGTATL